jgi:hypothetical protein
MMNKYYLTNICLKINLFFNQNIKNAEFGRKINNN